MKLLKEVRNKSIGYPQILLEGEGVGDRYLPLFRLPEPASHYHHYYQQFYYFFVVVFIHTNFFEKYKNLQGKALLFDEKSQGYKSSETMTC